MRARLAATDLKTAPIAGEGDAREDTCQALQTTRDLTRDLLSRDSFLDEHLRMAPTAIYIHTYIHIYTNPPTPCRADRDSISRSESLILSGRAGRDSLGWLIFSLKIQIADSVQRSFKHRQIYCGCGLVCQIK